VEGQLHTYCSVASAAAHKFGPSPFASEVITKAETYTNEAPGRRYTRCWAHLIGWKRVHDELTVLVQAGTFFLSSPARQRRRY
jgi:hypothetical protein